MNRRVIVFAALMGVLLSLALLSGTAFAQQSGGVKGRVISDGLRVRAQPSNTAAQIGLLKAAALVTVLGKNQNSTWLLIRSDAGLTGWVGSPYIALTQGTLKDVPVVDENAAVGTSAPEATEAASETPCPPSEGTGGSTGGTESTPAATGVRGRVISDGLRVRSEPNSTAAQVGLLKAASFVIVLGKNGTGTWLLVRSDSGLTGWVGSAFVRITEGSLKDVPVTDETVAPTEEAATEAAPSGENPCPTEEATASATPEAGTTEEATATPAAGNARGRVISDGLRVRSKPNNTSAQIGVLKAAAFVTVLGKNEIGTWLLVRSDSGLTGWVGSAYIALVEGTLKGVPVVGEDAPVSTPTS
jgi:uncharacterized protein YgiM (DUF1202 family)